MAKKKAKKASARSSAAKRSKPSDPTPAYFLSLTVQNVRCFGPDVQTLDLSDGNGRPAPWTVLLGNNGTGKTTLLECLAAFDSVNSDIPEYDETPRGFDWASRFPHHHLNRIQSNQPAILVALTQHGSRLNDRNTKPRQGQHAISLDTFTASFGYPEGAERVMSLPICYAYGASRHSAATSPSGGDHDDHTATLFDDRAALRNGEEWLRSLDYAASKQSKIQHQQRERFEQVRSLLENVLPDVTDVRISQPTKAQPLPRVEFETPDGWVPLQWIGYGYRTLVAWMIDFASRMVERYPDSKDPLAEPAVVLVDEIDLHLHPKWQRSLMEYLSERFPNTQFIVTAHSPLFVQAAAGANLVVLRRDKKKGHVIIDNDVEAIQGWRVDQVLTSDLFGLKTARPPQVEEFVIQRAKLLTKPKLTAADRKRLAQLEERIGPLPGGETADDAKTRVLLEKTLRALENERSGRP